MYVYPATIVRADDQFMVTFRDIPEANTCGATPAEAREMASDALETALEFYFEDNRAVPPPSAIGDDDVPIELRASISAKVLLLNAMVETGTSPASLARLMGTTRQEMHRILTLQHPTKIDTIGLALNRLGRSLIMKSQPDLYERRLAVLNAANTMFSKVARGKKLTPEDDYEYLVGTLAAKWVFCPEVHEYLSNEAWPKLAAYACHTTEGEGRERTKQQVEARAKRAELMIWFSRQHAVLAKMTDTHMAAAAQAA